MQRSQLWPVIIVCTTIALSSALVGDTYLWGASDNPKPPTVDPNGPCVFQLVLDNGAIIEEYTQCFGLGSSNELREEIVEAEHGVLIKQKAPGALEWHDIVLKRPGPSALNVWSWWRQEVEVGAMDRATHSGAIIMFRKEPYEVLARWDFHRGWPASLTFDGGVETLTIVHERITRVEPQAMQPVRR